MTDAVRLEREGNIAVVTIDNPPVNAGSIAVRQGLIAAFGKIAGDKTVIGAVLIGAGRTFVAGSDIREFGKPLADPQLPAVIAAIEECPKPVIVAIHGAALGGGYELALGCDIRIATPDAKLGLPEVTLGMIPGAGGTVRLPRIVDPAEALDIVVTGKRVPAPEALKLGMIDAVTTGDLRAAAIELARSPATAKRRLRDLPVRNGDPARFETGANAALKRNPGRKPVSEAIASLRRALALPFGEALAQERAAFQELRQGDEAAALRHLFFAERESAKIDGVSPDAAIAVRRIAVIGAGTMGAGIAAACLAAGYETRLIDIDAASLARGTARIADIAAQDVAKGRITADAAAERAKRLTASMSLADAADCDLAIEAVIEDMAIKRRVFGELDMILPAPAILASNTSYLDLDVIAAATKRPESVVGLHFFSPANVMRLLEIVRGAKTGTAALATALAVAKKLGKLPVVARVGEGFIGNRIYSAYRRECEIMVEDGAAPAEIDAALTGYGFKMGPFAVWDMSGLDIAWHTRQRLIAEGKAPTRALPLLDRLYEAGRLGRKTGGGWYDYPAGTPSPIVAAMIDERRRELGGTTAPIPAEKIVARVLAAMTAEAEAVLEDGIAVRASDIDLVMVNGYGFPAHKGGPMFQKELSRQ